MEVAVASESTVQTGSRYATVASLAAARAVRHPSHVAVRQKHLGIWHETSWGAIWDLVITAAHGLLSLDVDVGDRVAIHSENRIEWIVMDLAAVAVRATTIGIYPTSPATEVAYMLRDSGAKVLLAEDQEQVDKALDVSRTDLASLEAVIFIDDRGLAGYEDDRLLSWEAFLEVGRSHRASHPGAVDSLMAAAQAADVMTLVYTSGTTEAPKGAMLTNDNVSFAIDTLINSAERMPRRKLPSPNDEILSAQPLCHVTERAFSTWQLVACGSVLNFAEGTETLPAALREVQPTLFFAVPRVWEKLHAEVLIRGADASFVKRAFLNRALAAGRWIGRQRVAHQGRWTVPTRIVYAIGWLVVYRALRTRLGLRHCRYAASGTAPIAPEVLEFFIGIGLNVYETYGMTETTGIGTANLDGQTRIGTVGEPYEAIKDGFRIDAATGEIQMRHRGVFTGYWARPDATAAAFTDDGWFHTGDVGEWVDDTHVKIVDRLTHLIVLSDGRQVAPSELEKSLKTSPFIKEAMVIGNDRPHLSALIAIDADAAGNWCQKHDIAYTTYRDLAAKEGVVGLVQEAVDATNEKLAGIDSIKAFRLLPKELDHEDGELTATLKLKRNTVEATYRDVVESMY